MINATHNGTNRKSFDLINDMCMTSTHIEKKFLTPVGIKISFVLPQNGIDWIFQSICPNDVGLLFLADNVYLDRSQYEVSCKAIKICIKC